MDLKSDMCNETIESLLKDGFYHILPSFFKMLAVLCERGTDFRLIFRTFGSDTANVVTEFNTFCNGEHPLFTKYFRWVFSIELSMINNNYYFKGTHTTPNWNWNCRNLVLVLFARGHCHRMFILLMWLAIRCLFHFTFNFIFSYFCVFIDFFNSDGASSFRVL